MPLFEDQVSTYYEEHGAAGDPLLLIMGLGCDLLFWEFQTPVFARAHRTIVFDNRGVGRSSKPPGPYTVQLLADDAMRLLDHLRIPRAHLLGLSMGGMIAQDLALRFPDRVGALVLAATYARPDAAIRQVSEAGAEQLGGGPLALLQSGAIDPKELDLRQLFKFLISLVLSAEFIEREQQWLSGLLERTLATGPSIEAFLAQVSAVLHHDAAALLGRLRAPTLVLVGDADRLVPPHHSEELAKLIPGARLVKLAGGTHGFNIEMAERFNRVVLEFLREHPL